MALALWKRFRDLSIVEYKALYGRLNVHFDVYSGESLYGEAMKVQVADMKAKDLLQEDNGALLCDLSKHKLSKVVIEKRDGTTLYITRDVVRARVGGGTARLSRSPIAHAARTSHGAAATEAAGAIVLTPPPPQRHCT